MAMSYRWEIIYKGEMFHGYAKGDLHFRKYFDVGTRLFLQATTGRLAVREGLTVK